MAIDREAADPGVLIRLGGKERILVFKNWSWMQLEKLQQKSLLGRAITFASLNDLISFTWAGLIKREPRLDGFISANGEPSEKAAQGIKQVAEWLDELGDQSIVVEKILEALGISQPKPDEAEQKN